MKKKIFPDRLKLNCFNLFIRFRLDLDLKLTESFHTKTKIILSYRIKSKNRNNGSFIFFSIN